MSQNDGASGAITLEEALAELEGLKEQLSGSDLKVFTQNRELRQETTKLREEVTRLAEECVTQTFGIRTLEKAKAGLEQVKASLEQSKAELEQNKAELESQVANLTSRVAELENRVAELTDEVGVHRSQEIHLSQELERTISANAEEVARMLTEHDSELANTRENLEKVRAELEEDLTGKLQAREAAIENLERRVEQFKEEFLSQEVASPIVSLPPTVEQGRAFNLLREKMEGLLGFPGKAMVEQVFRLCGADEATSDPGVLEEAFEALQDTAAKLVRSPEQEQELSELLSQAWNELGLDARQFQAPAPAAVPAVESVAEVESTQPSAEAEALESAEPEAPRSAEEEASASAEVELADAVEVEEEAAAEAEPEAAVEPEVETVSQPVFEEQGDVAEEAYSGITEEAPEVESPVEFEPASVEPSIEDAPQTEILEEQAAAADESQAVEPDDEPESEPVEDVPAAESESIEAPAPSQEEESSQEVSSEVQEVAEEVVLATEEAPTEEAEEEPSLETSMESSLLDTEAVTEEDMPAIVEPVEPSVEPVLDSIEEAVAASLAEEAAGEPSTETEAAPEAVSDEVAPESAELETPEPEAAVAEANADEAASDDGGFEAAAAALAAADYQAALPIFQRLRSESPEEATYQVGEVSALAGLERYEEAYALGKTIAVGTLGDSEEHFSETFEAVLVGRVELAETLVGRKLALIELIDFVKHPERVQAYLDEVDEIPLRTPAEGRLSLKQAQARVEQDDVTDYLIEALQSLHDRFEIFDILRQNLDRYPELAPLSELTDRLLNSSRDEAIEAEGPAQSLLVGEETLEDLLNETDPGEEALVQVFLEHLLPRTGLKMELPSEAFEDLLGDSEPAAFVGALRQALRSVDYTLFFDEIEVLSYDGDEHFLLRSSPEPKATLLFGSDVDDVPPEELRFLVLRELFSMNRRHSHLAHLSAQLDDKFRYAFVKACLDIHKEAEFSISDELLAQLGELEGMAQSGGQDPAFKAKLENTLLSVYQATESDSFMEIADFLYDGQLHKKWLDPLADSFAAKQTGIVVASFAIARDVMEAEDFEAVEEAGFGWLYQSENLGKYQELRLRLQRLWSMPFKALVAESEE